MSLIRQIAALFERGERWRIVIIALGLMVRAAVETVGVSSIAPFMSVVANPAVVETNRWLRTVYETFGFETVPAFLVALGAAVIAVLAVSNAISALTLWAMLRFAWGTHHRLGVRLLRGYLAQPYSVFVARNSASFNKTILTEVNAVVQGVLIPALNILSRGMVVIAISVLLIVLDPVLAAIILVVLGGAYGTLYGLVRQKQLRLGRARTDANVLRFKVTDEAFGGIKDVKVLQREEAFVRQFVPASRAFSHTSASNQTVSQIPRYLFETLAFGGIVAIVLYSIRSGNGVEQILPVISIYAFAGYRLMPELQNLFAAVAAIRFNRAALDDLTDDLDQYLPQGDHEMAEISPVRLDHEVRFDDVTFQYAGAERPALDRVSLDIPKNQTIGLVGPSGSGKTTLVDLLLGLYEPDEGAIRVDGIELDEGRIRGWKRCVGYVPQQIFLADDTIAGNVAFGVPAGDIDRTRVETVARQAHLHDFVDDLPEGYDTVVGERGVRLSGGQRQRIGIARALYHDPDVLVMDEATSALDGATESAVMDAIGVLAGQKTIVLIAHRLSTVMGCDRIYLLEHGRVAASGSFDELNEQNASFRSMAQLGTTPHA